MDQGTRQPERGVDVNAAFAGEKAAQIAAVEDKAARSREWLDGQLASGAVGKLGGGWYEYLTGWDRGERFRVELDAAGQIAAIVNQHGLDVDTTGRVALYASSPAWHGLGQIIPGGTTDVDKVLAMSGLDFTVTTVPAMYEWLGELRRHDGRFTTVREDTGEALGSVGKKYVPIQNADGFGFLQELVGETDVVWESAGALRGGRRVFVSIRLPQTVTVDADGINDEIVPYVAIFNDHTGGGGFTCVVTPWRPVCANTERFAVRDAHTSWTVRHTRGATAAIREARRTLGLSVRYFEQFTAEENALARTDIAVADFHAVLGALWPLEEDATDKVKANHAERTEQLDAMFRAEAGRLGRTAYAAERTITDFLDHRTRVVPRNLTEDLARAQRALEGGYDDEKSSAHRRLMLLTTR
ncbi:DUF932 domain-containing protein [Streptomyces synnematoformans]|uniref:DUF932 domain-containing protein n=1 Tax=Streptomyces synnematoformans TaxID=415721 RepID=A0ABN2XA13_9ACTN